jgi:hypothetical protein
MELFLSEIFIPGQKIWGTLNENVRFFQKSVFENFIFFDSKLIILNLMAFCREASLCAFSFA